MADSLHDDLQELDAETCRRLLASKSNCRVGFVSDDGLLHILPVTHAVFGEGVAFKSAPGTKLGQAAAGGRVVVQADAADDQGQTGWSVLGRGRAHIVTDEDTLAELMALPFRPWSEVAEEGMWVLVDIEEWHGRRITHD